MNEARINQLVALNQRLSCIIFARQTIEVWAGPWRPEVREWYDTLTDEMLRTLNRINDILPYVLHS